MKRRSDNTGREAEESGDKEEGGYVVEYSFFNGKSAGRKESETLEGIVKAAREVAAGMVEVPDIPVMSPLFLARWKKYGIGHIVIYRRADLGKVVQALAEGLAARM